MKFYRCILDSAVGISGWKVGIIKDPDFHVLLSCFIEDNIHILPPFLTAEVRMRSRFDADRLAAGIVYDLHHLSEHAFIFTMLPEERKDIVSAVSL